MIADIVIAIPAGPIFDPRLRLTLESLRCQKANIKVAFCDASGDPRARQLAAEFSDIIGYVRHGSDTGQSAAINEGWRALTGRIYGWLNVDDYLAPNALSLAQAAFDTRPDADVVYGQSLMARGGDFVGIHREVQPPSDYLYRSNIISQPSCFVRQRALFDIGLVNEDLHFTMDWDLWARLMRSGAKFHYEPNLFSVVALSGETKTSQLGKARLSEIKAILTRYNDRASIQKSLAAMRLENISEYSALGPLMKRAKRLLPHKKMQVRPFEGGLGQNISCLELPIFHFDEPPKNRLTLVFDSQSVRTVHAEGHEALTTGDKSVEIPVDLAPATTVNLSITAKNETAIALKLIQLT